MTPKPFAPTIPQQVREIERLLMEMQAKLQATAREMQQQLGRLYQAVNQATIDANNARNQQL